MRSTIRQFDAVKNPLRAARADKPYLVCVQHPLLDHLNSRVMVPLATTRVVPVASRMQPAIRLGQDILFFDPTEILTLPIQLLRPAIANLAAERDKIVAALDLVFTGV